MPPKICNQVQLFCSFQKKVVTGLFAKESSHWIHKKVVAEFFEKKVVTGFKATKNLLPRAIIGFNLQESSR
jgi:hypothetical protein